MLHIEFKSTYGELALHWMPQNTVDYKSTIGSGNGLVLWGNKLLPGILLAYIFTAVFCH